MYCIAHGSLTPTFHELDNPATAAGGEWKWSMIAAGHPALGCLLSAATTLARSKLASSIVVDPLTRTHSLSKATLGRAVARRGSFFIVFSCHY
jgi:hypothetical protein